jgi:hypothetical protein
MSPEFELEAQRQSPGNVYRGAGPLKPSQDLLQYAKTYAREKPDVFAMWCFGIGFVIGWKLKPW